MPEAYKVCPRQHICSYNAQFCPQCGANVSNIQPISIEYNAWARTPNDFAIRIPVENLKGVFQKTLVVEPGTNALIFTGDAAHEVLQPGSHTLDNLPQRLLNWFDAGAYRATALLVEVAPTDFDFPFNSLFSKDPQRVGLRVLLQARVVQPGVFVTNLLRGQDRLTREGLRMYLFPQVAAIVENWVRKHTLQELAENLELARELEQELELGLENTFKQAGLKFEQVRAVNFNFEALDRVHGVQATYALQASESEAHAAGRTRFLEVQKQLNLVYMADETAKVMLEEQRLQLNDRLRQALKSDRMNEVRSADDFAAFLNDIDRNKLLREKEREDLIRTWREEAEDHNRARAYAIAKVDAERIFDLRMAALRNQYQEGDARLEYEQEMARKQANFSAGMRRQAVQEELYLEDQRIEIERKKVAAQLDLRKQVYAQQVAEREQERLQDADDAQLAIDLLRQMKVMKIETGKAEAAVELWKKEENLRIDRVHQLELQDRDTDRKIREWEAGERIHMADRLHEIELKKLEAQREKDRLAALGAMSPEQIVATQSPEAGAQVLTAKYQSANAERELERERQLSEMQRRQDESQRDYERRLNDLRVQQALDAAERQNRQLSDLAGKALENNVELGKAVSGGHPQPSGPVIVTPGMGVGGVTMVPPAGGVGMSGGVKNCPNCGKSVELEAFFCKHCGAKFPGMGQ